MRLGWRWQIMLGLVLAAPAAARSGTAGAPAAPAPAASPGPAIEVQGKIAPKSDWKRAEGDHVIVFSKGSEGELKRVTRTLELVHTLMTHFYGPAAGAPDDLPKLRVTLLDPDSRFRSVALQPPHAQEGPFPTAFASRAYLDPRADGDALIAVRSDTIIDINTPRRFKQACDDLEANADGESPMCGMAVKAAVPVVRSWETNLYAAYARHFLLSYQPAAYPRWFVDGIGGIFSVVAEAPHGQLLAVQPARIGEIYAAFGYPDVAAIVSGRYLNDSKAGAAWTPYGAWLLVHYLLYNNKHLERRGQLKHYMAAVQQGTPMADAAAVFGDMKALQREVQLYANSQEGFVPTVTLAATPADPLVSHLSAGSGAIVEARVEMQARLDVASDPAGTAGWLDAFTASLGGEADNKEALLLIAEADCRGGQAAACLTVTDKVLATSPDDVTALTWKGAALTDQALAAPVADRPARLTAARAVLQRALAIDGQAALPQTLYFESFIKAGEPAPPDAIRGMVAAIREAPVAPGPRLALARELARSGRVDLARRVADPLLYGAYDSAERTAAQSLFAPAGAPTAGAP